MAKDVKYRVYWMKKRKRRDIVKGEVREIGVLGEDNKAQMLEAGSSTGKPASHDTKQAESQTIHIDDDPSADPAAQIEAIFRKMQSKGIDVGLGNNLTASNSSAALSTKSAPSRASSKQHDAIISIQKDSFKILDNVFVEQVELAQKSDPISHLALNLSRLKMRHLELQLAKRPEWREHFNVMVPIFDLRSWSVELLEDEQKKLERSIEDPAAEVIDKTVEKMGRTKFSEQIQNRGSGGLKKFQKKRRSQRGEGIFDIDWDDEEEV